MVELHVANVAVAGSSPVSRSKNTFKNQLLCVSSNANRICSVNRPATHHLLFSESYFYSNDNNHTNLPCQRRVVSCKFRRYFSLGSRPTAGHQTLDLSIGVRIPASQQEFLKWRIRLGV